MPGGWHHLLGHCDVRQHPVSVLVRSLAPMLSYYVCLYDTAFHVVLRMMPGKAQDVY